MVETKKCVHLDCEGTMYHNKGISKKTNKPYENWKCNLCKEVEWVDNIYHDPKPNKQDIIQKNVERAQEDRAKSSQSAQKGGAAHDATDIAIFMLGNKTKSSLTTEGMEKEWRYWFKFILKELNDVNGNSQWDAKKQEIYNHDSELDDINAEMMGKIPIIEEEIDTEDIPF